MDALPPSCPPSLMPSSISSIRGVSCVVALSGGVDSAVSMLLLKEMGCRVSGIYMKNWNEADEGICRAQDDLDQVDQVCRLLNIPYEIVDFQREYWHNVFEPALDDYQSGVTPNPDVWCNREIKFHHLPQYVFNKNVEAEFLATGHYARRVLSPVISQDQGHLPNKSKKTSWDLYRANDEIKDQTYFLLQVPSTALERIHFPIGHLMKKQVRQLAREANLPNANRVESMGLCFVGKRRFNQFLNNYLPPQPETEICAIEDGKPLAKLENALYYTIGQRIPISGSMNKMFVVEKDISSSKIMVTAGTNHPSLYRTTLGASQWNWFDHSIETRLQRGEIIQGEAKIRHGQSPSKCMVWMKEKNRSIDSANPTSNRGANILLSDRRKPVYMVEFSLPIRAICQGQAVGFYQGEKCLGGGIIVEMGPSCWDLGLTVPKEALI